MVEMGFRVAEREFEGCVRIGFACESWEIRTTELDELAGDGVSRAELQNGDTWSWSRQAMEEWGEALMGGTVGSLFGYVLMLARVARKKRILFLTALISGSGSYGLDDVWVK
jgi:hypothetical protein